MFWHTGDDVPFPGLACVSYRDDLGLSQAGPGPCYPPRISVWGGWLSQHMVGWERCWPSSLQKGDVLLSLGVFLSLLERAALEGGSKVTRGGEGLLQA